ncbi:hypothetical protein [Sphingomonas glacialis]|nr:hypothetical protein [Sphingomonas glacialis]
MRLLEVRDWLNGQSWWDVSQHRLWDGHFAMHWSRLVDLPLALMMAVFDPIFGPAAATRVALVALPLVTLLAVMALGAELTRRVAGLERAKMAVLLVPLSIPLLYQLRPLRIDHHGWQIVLALIAANALLAKPDARSGSLIGLALAALLTISLEGMPITVAILGVALLAWAFDPTRRAQALAASWTLTGAVIVLHVATRGPAILTAACDAISPAWIAGLSTATLGVTLAMIVRRAPLAIRLGMLGVAGAAALAMLGALAPKCFGGPFAGLDPLVRTFWYDKVSEGLPIWDQVRVWALMTIGFPIVGLIGGLFAWRASEGRERVQWAMVLALAVGSFALSLLVVRSGATANALALPGGAWALQAMLTRARAVTSVAIRTLATAGSLTAATPGLMAVAILGVGNAFGIDARPAAPKLHRPSCEHGHEIVDLGQLPPSRVFAPLDVTPDILARTKHSAIGAGYHRNVASIHTVIATFIGTPQDAHRRVLASGAAYVVGCPGENETEMYKQAAPNGFWSRLERGDRFAWLQPVPLSHSPVLVWKVMREPTRP